MIDIHSHIINEIDDGSRSFSESIILLKKLETIGITHIIATPHYITGSSYTANNISKKEKLNRIQKSVQEEELKIKVYLGNEVFIAPEIVSLIKAGEIMTLNNSKYVLIEFPVYQPMPECMEILFIMRSKGYIPVIAHPERYIYLQEDIEQIDKFLEMGCLFQGNVENIVSKYGHHAKKLFLYMLKNNKYQILATDVHHQDDILFKNFKSVKKEIIKLTSLEKWQELTVKNPLKILENENIIEENF